MKSFLFLLKDKQAADLSPTLLTEHVGHLQKLHQTGNLALCGPFADGNGAMLVLRAHHLQEAIALFESDPFIQKKYYSGYEVQEVVEANNRNNWLLQTAAVSNLSDY